MLDRDLGVELLVERQCMSVASVLLLTNSALLACVLQSGDQLVASPATLTIFMATG